MHRFYWPEDETCIEACYDKKDESLWILGQYSLVEREFDWNHWEVFRLRDNTAEFEYFYWWWGRWDPIPPRDDVDLDPYWPDAARFAEEHRVCCLLEQAKEFKDRWH